jgi:hypothetical protein
MTGLVEWPTSTNCLAASLISRDKRKFRSLVEHLLALVD